MKNLKEGLKQFIKAFFTINEPNDFFQLLSLGSALVYFISRQNIFGIAAFVSLNISFIIDVMEMARKGHKWIELHTATNKGSDKYN